MKKSTEKFVYKHITKLPWIGATVWTLSLAWGFQLSAFESFLGTFIRLFIFGFGFYSIFWTINDRVAVKFRRKVLLSTPRFREACIENILEGAGVYAIEANADENED